MPELPEVETVVNGIQHKLLKSKVIDFSYSGKKLRADLTNKQLSLCLNAQFMRVYRRAKYIICDLSNSYSVVFHLGMSGKLLLQNEPDNKKHNHVIFKINNREDYYYLVFNDPRRFGLCSVIKTDEINKHKLFRNLGIEPLSDLTFEKLSQLLENKKSGIKSFLMNGNFIVGIGNIYASEALYKAKINPLRQCCTIKADEIRNLIIAIKNTLLDAIKAGGSTLKDYVNHSGNAGYFQHKFLVYDKEGESCNICTDVIRKTIISGRSTYYCASCQK